MLAGNIVKNYAEDLAAALIKLLLDLAGFGIGYNAGGHNDYCSVAGGCHYRRVYNRAERGRVNYHIINRATHALKQR